MDAERALVSRVVQTGKGAGDLAAEGLSEQHFIHDDCLEVWLYVLNHLNRYGKQPSIPTVIEKFPHFNFEHVDEPVVFLKDRFIEAVERREAVEFAKELARACNDPDRAGKLGDLILEQGRHLKNMLPGNSVVRFSDAAQRIKTYEERAKSGDYFTGIRMGIPEIDEATLGIQPHELVSVVGWQGTGKSTLIQWILLNFYQQEKRSLFISLEMSAEALMRKWDQMMQQFTSYKHLKQLNLSDEEVKRWKDWAKNAKKRAATAEILAVADGGSWTPERVHGEIMRHKPDIVAIDYITLMETGDVGGAQRWEKLTKLSRQLKQIAIATETPIFSVAQTSRDSAKHGAELDNIGGSYSIGADSDIVIGLHQDEEMREWKTMEVRLVKNRDGETISSEVYWDMSRMHFADDFKKEQMLKSREAAKLEEAPQEEKPARIHRLGLAAAEIQADEEVADGSTD